MAVVGNEFARPAIDVGSRNQKYRHLNESLLPLADYSFLL
jgi:hypothetical protein